MPTAEQIIEIFGMKPLPEEGGYYVETYRAGGEISGEFLPDRDGGSRNLGTAILYLLTSDTFSGMHRLNSDEVFHFYSGDPVQMLQLKPDGSGQVLTLGQDIVSGEKVQVTVLKDTWQGLMLKEGGRFALMGTTVVPGFEFEDFETAAKDDLIKEYPAHKDLISKLTR